MNQYLMYRYSPFILLVLWLLLPIAAISQENGDKSFTIAASIENETDLLAYLNWWRTNQKKFSLEDEIVILKKSINVASTIGLDSINCVAHYELGLLYLYEDHMPNAFSYLKESVSFRDKVNNNILFAWINNALGLVYYDAGELEEALAAYLTSYEDFMEVNSNFATYPLGNISDTYNSLGDKSNAIKYTLEAVKYTKQLKGHHYAYNYGYDCANLSRMYDDIEQADSALIYMERSLDQIAGLDVKHSHSSQLMFEIYQNAFSYYLKRDRFEQAKKYLSLAKEAFDDKPNLLILDGTYYLATNQQEQLFESFKADTLAISEFDAKKDYLKLKKDAYQKYGYFQEALEMADSLAKLDQQQHVSEKKKYAVFADAKFENLKKVKKINELEKERNLNQLTIQKHKAYQFAQIAGLISVLILAFFIYYRYRQKNKFSEKLQLEVDQKTKILQTLNSNLATKNIELKQFNHILSHDLKEPLRSIVSFSSLLQKESAGNSVFQEYTGYIVNAGRQLYSLIEDIKKFQDLDQMNFNKEEVNLKEVLENVVASLSTFIADKNAIVNYEALPTIIHSKSALFLIFKNLIENGIKYNKQQTPTIKISCQKIHEDIHISFSDNGIGIDQAYFDKIFIMFKRLHTRSEYKGSGIGIAFSQKVAKKTKSLIVISKSELNIGTTFTLIIKSLKAPILKESQIVV